MAAACSPARPPAATPSFESVADEAFGGYNPRMDTMAFDLVFADADVDGDPDLLINWHLLAPLELFLNDGGVLRLADPREPGWRLPDNAAAPGLFCKNHEAEAAIRARNEPGLYLWHEPDRIAGWHFFWFDPADRFGGVAADLETSLRFWAMAGLAEHEFVALDARHRRLAIAPGRAERRFGVVTDPIDTQLVVTLRPSPRGTPRLFAGIPPVEQPGTVSLWKPDPHGVAWVDVEGTPHPEVFVTRGAMAGELVPPIPPKSDQYYAFEEGYVERPFPSGYNRGRGVEWVDIDNDGVLELSIANEKTPNQLFAREPGGFVDRAGGLGIDFVGAVVQCWGDADDDGFQDLFYLDEDQVRVLRNDGGRGFAPPPAGALAMPLPAVAERAADELFDRAVLRLADFDADGDLDLWVLSRGDERRNTLFLRDGPAFVEAGERTGLAAITGNDTNVLADFNNDGYEDLLATGAAPPLWVNEGGRRLIPVDGALQLEPRIEAAGAADVDGDGRVDVVAAGSSRVLLKNRTPGPATSVEVDLRDPRGNPIGALVTAVYADGRRLARRWGAERSIFSQTAGPVRFAAGPGNTIARIDVRWPGERTAAGHPVAPGTPRIVIERR